MKKRKPIRVPKAPKNLWRTILAAIEEDPSKLEMSAWHGRTRQSRFHGTEVREVSGKSRKCATTHCQAGFVTYFTKGGYDLESEISRRRLVSASEEAQKELGISDYVYQSCDIVEMAALWILEKSGWAKDVPHGSFFRSNEDALQNIKRLARLEAKREGEKYVPRRAKRTAARS